MKTFRFLLIAVVCILAGGRGIALGQCVPPPSGMVAWWPLDETSSPANDLAGVNNVGTWMNNPTPVSGKVAGALSFNGTNHIEAANHAELNLGTGNFSIDAWVKRDSASTNSPPSVIVDKRDGSGIGYSLAVSYGRLVFNMSGTNYATTTYPVPADGQWHFVAVTVNRATNVGRFYSDSIALDAFTPLSGDLDNTNDLRIGKGYLGGNQPWLGCIDELEIFNQELDSMQIRGIWAANSLGKYKPDTNCINPPPGMVAWWPLDEQVGATIVEDIAGSHNGTPSPGGQIGNGDPLLGPMPASLWPQIGGGKCDDALYFVHQFQNRFVRVPAHADLQFGLTDFSIDAWVFINAYNPTDIQPIVEKMQYNGTTPDLGYRFYLESGVLSFTLAWGSGWWCTFTTAPSQISLDVWHHVAVTVDRHPVNGAATKLYVDGTVPSWGTCFLFNESIANTEDLIIGGSILGPAINYRDIVIDELEIFNRVLTPLEVYSIWAADTLCKCKPVARNHYKTWRFPPQYVLETRFVKDQFMSDSLKLDALDFLSNPVKKVVQNDTFNIIKPNDHLTWYRAQGRDTLLKITYVNQFESTSVLIDTAKYLLLPTQKLPHAPPVSLDHYKAYRIRNPKSLFMRVQLQDQFDPMPPGPENIDTLKQAYFLTPAQKNNEPQFDTITHYVAYEIIPRRTVSIPVNTQDQFGPHGMVIQRSELLLVPTKKLSVGPPPDTLRNHYKTWRIQPLPFDSSVFVQDQFRPDSGMFVRLDSIDFLSNPAKKVVENDTFDIKRPNDHLTWYRAKSLAPTKRFKVKYVNQFESSSLVMDTLRYLLLPTQKDPHPEPDSLLGHYTAYRIKNPKSLIRQVQLQDQFDMDSAGNWATPENIDTLMPVYFLTPAQKNNEPRFEPDTHYVAYEIFPKRVAPQTRATLDQFGPHFMQIQQSELLLVPTNKVSVKYFKAGDANGDGKITVSDVVFLVNYQFKGGPAPDPIESGDANCDGKVTVSDVVYLINYLFKGGPPPR